MRELQIDGRSAEELPIQGKAAKNVEHFQEKIRLWKLKKLEQKTGDFGGLYRQITRQEAVRLVSELKMSQREMNIETADRAAVLTQHDRTDEGEEREEKTEIWSKVVLQAVKEKLQAALEAVGVGKAVAVLAAGLILAMACGYQSACASRDFAEAVNAISENNAAIYESMENMSRSSKERLVYLQAEHERMLEEEALLLAQQQNLLVDSYERDIIERVVAAEARGESLEGMMAVAQVIRDRAELWGMTPVEVVTQKSQFAAPYGGAISQEVKQAVSMVFDNDQRVFSEPVTHFYSGEATPYWTKSKVNRGTIGRHKFWY